MFEPIFALPLVFLFYSYLVAPIITYIWDPKNLRRYPNFHPLSGISDIPFLLAAQKGFHSRTLHALRQHHPVIRVGPNALSHGAPAAIKDIHGHGTTCVKDRFYSETSGSHAHLADVVDKQDHARKKKVLASAYTIKYLEGWEYKVSDMTARLIRVFDDRCTEALRPSVQVPEERDLTLDFRSWTNHFTVAAIANIGLSEDLGFLEQGSDKISSESMDGQVKNRLSKVLSPYYRNLWKLDADWNGIVYSRATRRLKRYLSGEKLDDFFTAMMEDKKGAAHNLEMGEIVAEISIMMNAGSDTIAIALRNVLFFLLKNTRCMARLREEIDEVLDGDEIVAPYSKVKHLSYLRACLDESLRMLPPVIFGLPRRTLPEGTTILGEHVAGDTSVSISAYVVHHDESVYKDNNTYLPERWLGEEGKSLQSYLIPFSTGARGCIGRNISYLEQTVVLASLTTNLSPGPMPLKIWKRVHA
ncbi:cytochrome P450 [Aspergillus foveolatus]|uniref:cytochrome P450 n=1 Tax=Aspergillus foveolatus TaxID=210207 RepID=UPI003CCCEADD